MAKEMRGDNYFDPIFGACNEFSIDQLPTKADIIKNILFLRENATNRKDSNKPYIQQTMERVKNIWQKINIPIICDSSINRSITRVYEKYTNCFRNKNRKNVNSMFKNEMEHCLFDIAICNFEK